MHLHRLITDSYKEGKSPRFVHEHEDSFEEHPGVEAWVLLCSPGKTSTGVLVHILTELGNPACGTTHKGMSAVQGQITCAMCKRLLSSAPGDIISA